MQVRLSSGGYEIISSGHTFLFGKERSLKIDVSADNDFEFSVVLQFQEDALAEQRIEKEMVGNTILLSCVNFLDSGTGLNAPVCIAEIDGKGLFFMFWSYLEGKEKVRSVKYTFFYEK